MGEDINETESTYITDYQISPDMVIIFGSNQ